MSAPHDDTTSTTVDPDLVAMMHAVFAEHCERHEPTTTTADWDPLLWNRLHDLGLARLTGRAEHGGSGAGWFEAAELLRAAAWHGVRVPLAEHDLLAGWLLDAAGLPVDDTRRTVCVLDAHGAATGVPWAGQAERIVAAWRFGDTYRVADVDTAVVRNRGVNRAGEPHGSVAVDTTDLPGVSVADTVIEQLRLRGALARAIQICAALDRILDLSLAHTTERTQFGRALGKFQTVQNLVADIAAESALARTATDAALADAVRSDWVGANLEFLVAVARSCAGHAAAVVARNAHQVHGAIGTTREHCLHAYTQPALAWRNEYGTVQHWDDWLTTAATTAGRNGLWPLLTA